VAGDPSVLYLREPDGYRFDGVQATGARVVGQEKEGGIRAIRLESATGGVARWRVAYRAPE
jgi:hypothetical protein